MFTVARNSLAPCRPATNGSQREIKTRLAVVLGLLLVSRIPLLGQETLPPLAGGHAPQTYEALWSGYDPRAEPLESETLHAWEEDGVVMRVVRYRVGVFNGQKAMMAAVYGFPRGATKLPGLVQIHGGGQYADYRAVLTNARRGYATISISWAGRINAPGYKVDPRVVQLFFASATTDPAYKLTTDWGALDAYHAPSRNPGNASFNITPAAWTLDPVESPRNSAWFLWTLGARRALTFLEQQPEVNAAKLGVYGHSMGGKITVLTAGADSRVRAAAPSCGGVSDLDSRSPLYRATLADDVYLKRISSPIVFLSPANDFNGRIDDLQKAVRQIPARDWRATASPHHSHQDSPAYEVATQLWFDQHLKGSFSFPRTPGSTLELRTRDGVPSFVVTPDAGKPIMSVDVFYTQQGQLPDEKYDRENTKSRFWRHAVARKTGSTWRAELPVFSTDEPLWVYANVAYPLEQPVSGAGYYYNTYTAAYFNLSSLMPMAAPEELKAAGVRATLAPSLVIETFASGWGMEWFSYKPAEWPRSTYKIYDGQYAAPTGAKLAVEVRSNRPNKLVVGIDQSAAEIQLTGGGRWQQVILSLTDFQNASGQALADWSGIKQLRLGHQETLNSDRRDGETSRVLGAKWTGDAPEFRNLRWLVDASR